jgi:hypothetical protein
MSRHPVISFAIHEVRAGNRAGAREDFQKMLALLVRAVTGKDAHLVAADPGDWGIDVLAGDLNGRAAIWQAKYFIDGVRENQYKEIRESFQSAVRNSSRYGYAIEVWALCLPASLGPGATRWWQGWAARQKRAAR